jgi:Arylsulfotransferase (ASST)
VPTGSVPPRLLAALGAAIALPAALILATPAAAAVAAPVATAPLAAAPAPAALAISPAAGTPDASPSTQISVFGVRPSLIQSVRVRGARSGVHSGSLKPYSGRRGASFVLKRPLDQGERVAVRVRIAGRAPIAFSFTVARLAVSPPVLDIPVIQLAKLDRFVTLPFLLAPRIKVNRGSASAGGDIFLTPLPSPVVHPESNNTITIKPVGPGGPMIIDSHGRLVWFDQLNPPDVATNFRPQRFAGHEVLTWWQGGVTSSAFGVGEGVIADTSYRTLRTVRAGNGYPTDLHEFVLTRSGDALFTAYSPVLVHLPGTAAGVRSPLLDSLVQEVDIRTGLVVWEWHALGHIPLKDSYATPANSADYDAFHLNSIEALPGGRMLVSARDASAVYLINRAGGRIVWTLGGKASSFRMARGARFYFQHDAQMVGRNEVSLFDDEAGPPAHASSSRGLLLGLDLRHHTAEMVSQYHRPGRDNLADSEGSLQHLTGGNVFVGFGSTTGFSEFTPGGKLVFDASLPTDDGSYREFRFPWSATPRTRPTIVAQRASPTKVSVYASWNGATTVARWDVLAGPNAGTLGPLAIAAKRGFETRINVSTEGTTFLVQALSATGRVLARSVPVTAS